MALCPHQLRPLQEPEQPPHDGQLPLATAAFPVGDRLLADAKRVGEFTLGQPQFVPKLFDPLHSL